MVLIMAECLIYSGCNNAGKTTFLSACAKVENVPVYDHSVLEQVEVEKWILNLFLADKSGSLGGQQAFRKVQEVLESGDITSCVSGFIIKSSGPPFKTWVEYVTPKGLFPFEKLGRSCQLPLAWAVDILKRLFINYPASASPLAEPICVLIDDLSAHLDLEARDRVLRGLMKWFPNIRIVATVLDPKVEFLKLSSI